MSSPFQLVPCTSGVITADSTLRYVHLYVESVEKCLILIVFVNNGGGKSGHVTPRNIGSLGEDIPSRRHEEKQTCLDFRTSSKTIDFSCKTGNLRHRF